MPRYGATTRKSPEEVIEQAKGYFGEDGLGLTLTAENPCCATFEGGGGHVSVTATREDDMTEVELETREWDYQVKKFMGRV